jgi:uncharacterized protein with LGFP repeats
MHHLGQISMLKKVKVKITWYLSNEVPHQEDVPQEVASFMPELL